MKRWGFGPLSEEFDATALQTFDAHTAEHTKRLAESYRRSADTG